MALFSVRDLSIRRKLSLGVLATTATALLIAFSVLTTHEVLTARYNLVESTATLAGIVGMNSSAALIFDDSSAAEENLRGLGADRNIAAAALYDSKGDLFAVFRQDPEHVVPESPGIDSSFEDGYLALFHQIRVDGEPVGALYLSASTRSLGERLQLYLLVLAGVACVAALVVAFVARELRRAVEEPIGALMERSEAMAHGDLSTLVTTEARDEIGALARSFNGMAQRLRTLVSQVRDNVAAVGRDVEGLERTSSRVEEETRRQVQTAEQAADSIALVVASIQKVNDGVSELAQTGGETSRSIGTMQDSINRVAARMDELAPAIDSTSVAVGQMTGSVGEIAQNVDTLNDATAITGASLGELTASVHRVRDNAERSHELSQGAHQEAERGMRSVNDTIASMQEIESSFKGLEEIVTRLAGRSQSIDEIVEVIDDVADETQLLSLNAAIIASQAGEQGSAFAVVAEEVKRLAERTAISTREIAGLTQHIGGEATEAVRAMSEGAETVSRGVVRSQEAGDRLQAIMESSSLARDMVDEIVGATQGQTADLEKVEEAMSQVRRFVHQIHRSTQEQNRASAEITHMVEQVRGLGNEVKSATVAQKQESGRIGEAMEKVTRMIDRILNATDEQRRSSDQIDRALGVFRDVAVESARRMEEVKAVTTTLAERSTRLDREIGRFKL